MAVDQRPAGLRSGLDSPEETRDWVPVAREHYQTSIIPWVRLGGRRWARWLPQNVRPSNDPNLMLVSPQLYDLWKAHATGSGGPFPAAELARQLDAPRPADQPAPVEERGWRATLVLGGLLIFSVFFIGLLLLLHR